MVAGGGEHDHQQCQPIPEAHSQLDQHEVSDAPQHAKWGMRVPCRKPLCKERVCREDALVNVSVEKGPDGKLAGYIRIR